MNHSSETGPSEFDFDDPSLKAALELHHGLARQGPGSAATTRRLLSLAQPIPSRPRVLDLGCGPGPAALLLAQEAQAEVTAIDLYPRFLDELRAAAEQAVVAERITPENRSMDDLPYPDGSFDLVWSEAAAYNIGFDTALRSWRRLLAPEGVLVVTELGWLTGTPHSEAREFWDAVYPPRTTAENVAIATAAGYTVVATYLLPDEDWFAEYYTSLEARIAGIDPGDALALEAAGHLRREIGLRRAHGADYGYVGYVLRPRG
ncbi:SAM-dependent methyltransferase [Lipingzhangella halophila]|uniref:SAM-dependent methyltransferase n=1 Tax=Lipingzhangella halophila TaxID=1783352 RepID=A0A7W7RFL9_9ACTN|nr:class I SAM-dependent methyltransferase [Lipingzhangella halophila]MBB4931086.1 SAM-dependent methyltransferase [Lipingzhangella halophila]